MVQKYRKKPVVIEAIQLTLDNVYEVLDFVGKQGGFEPSEKSDELLNFVIHTLEGDMEAKSGDYIIKGVQGEFYPCKQDIFEQTYEKVV